MYVADVVAASACETRTNVTVSFASKTESEFNIIFFSKIGVVCFLKANDPDCPFSLAHPADRVTKCSVSWNNEKSITPFYCAADVGCKSNQS